MSSSSSNCSGFGQAVTGLLVAVGGAYAAHYLMKKIRGDQEASETRRYAAFSRKVQDDATTVPGDGTPESQRTVETNRSNMTREQDSSPSNGKEGSAVFRRKENAFNAAAVKEGRGHGHGHSHGGGGHRFENPHESGDLEDIKDPSKFDMAYDIIKAFTVDDDMQMAVEAGINDEMNAEADGMKVGISSDTTCNQEGLEWGGMATHEQGGCCDDNGVGTASSGGGGCCNDKATPSSSSSGGGCCGGSSASALNPSSKREQEIQEENTGCCGSKDSCGGGSSSSSGPRGNEFITDDVYAQDTMGATPAGGKMHSNNVSSNSTLFMKPGKANVWLKTFGCSHNISDSEVMMGLIAAEGYTITPDMNKADLLIVNSCTVKNPSQDAAVNLVRQQARSKPVILTGCVSQADSALVKNLEKTNVSIVGLSYTSKIVEAVESVLAGAKVFMMDFMDNPLKEAPALPDLMLPKIRKNKFVEIIAINTGCLGDCTYCKTKQARGTLRSYPVEQIVRRAKAAYDEGVQQVWLTSEDTGAYGIDLGTNIVVLMRAIVDIIPKHGMLRLGMTNPPYMVRHAAEIAEILQHPRVFEFLHVPVQSGSDEVLAGMNREYTSSTFMRCVNVMTEKNPTMTFATDIICGFPGETDNMHTKTLDLITKYRFAVVNISQFYPRPGTKAAEMKRVATDIVKKRSGEVTELFLSYTKNDYLLNTTRQIWFSDTDVRRGQTVGHTKQHVKVVVPRDDSLLGNTKMVSIHTVTKWHVEGDVVGEVPDDYVML